MGFKQNKKPIIANGLAGKERGAAAGVGTGVFSKLFKARRK